MDNTRVSLEPVASWAPYTSQPQHGPVLSFLSWDVGLTPVVALPDTNSTSRCELSICTSTVKNLNNTTGQTHSLEFWPPGRDLGRPPLFAFWGLSPPCTQAMPKCRLLMETWIVIARSKLLMVKIKVLLWRKGLLETWEEEKESQSLREAGCVLLVAGRTGPSIHYRPLIVWPLRSGSEQVGGKKEERCKVTNLRWQKGRRPQDRFL